MSWLRNTSLLGAPYRPFRHNNTLHRQSRNVNVGNFTFKFMDLNFNLGSFTDFIFDKDPEKLKTMTERLQNPQIKIDPEDALYESRKKEEEKLVNLFNQVSFEKDTSLVISGTNGIGKTELIKNAAQTVNAQDSPLKCVYVRAHDEPYHFGQALSHAIGLNQTELELKHIFQLVRLGAASAVENGDIRLLFIIDDVSSRFNYLNELECEARQLSEQDGVSVALVGIDGTDVLAMKSLTQVRANKITIEPFDKEQLKEHCATKIPNNLDLLNDVTELIHNEYGLHLFAVNDLIENSADESGDINLDKMKSLIQQQKQQIMRKIEAQCYGYGLDIFDKRRQAIGELVKKYGKSHIPETDWVGTVEGGRNELKDKQSVGYKLILANYLCHYPEYDALRVFAPIVEQAIKEMQF